MQAGVSLLVSGAEDFESSINAVATDLGTDLTNALRRRIRYLATRRPQPSAEGDDLMIVYDGGRARYR